MKALISAGITLIIFGLIIGIFFNWNLVAAFNWVWSLVVSVFNFFVGLFTGDPVFRWIAS